MGIKTRILTVLKSFGYRAYYEVRPESYFDDFFLLNIVSSHVIAHKDERVKRTESRYQVTLFTQDEEVHSKELFEEVAEAMLGLENKTTKVSYQGCNTMYVNDTNQWATALDFLITHN